MITAEEKIKRQKNGNTHRYIYYHCTKRINPNCTQKAVRAEELEKQIKEAVNLIDIPKDLHEFALKWFKNKNAEKSQTIEAVVDTQQKSYKDCLKRLSGLIDMRAGQEITAEEFKMRKEPLEAEKKHWENLFNKTSQDVNHWLKKADEVFSFATDCKARFENGDSFKKKEILSRLGSHLLLKDRIIRIDMENTLIPLKAVAKENKRLEPLKIGKNTREIELLYAQSPKMLAWQDAFRTYDWEKAFPSPEATISQVKQLLALI